MNASRFQLLIAALLAVGAVVSLCVRQPWLAFTCLGLTNIFVGGLILSCASHGPAENTRFFKAMRTCLPIPDRHHALGVLLLLLLATVVGFGALYIGRTDIKLGAATLESATDAIYFSAVTLVTLGYGDVLPTAAPAKHMVMWEMASGLIFLILALPILTSRLSLLETQSTTTVAIKVAAEKVTVTIDGATKELSQSDGGATTVSLKSSGPITFA